MDEIKKLKMKDLKDLSDILEDVLNTHLRILKIKGGNIILTFHCLHDLDVLFPLHEIGVTRIFTGIQQQAVANWVCFACPTLFDLCMFW